MAPGVNVSIERKAFPDGRLLLADCHFRIEPGEVVALIGPSGIGKTSLLRMTSGVDCEYSGSITIGQQCATEAPRVGVMFQDPRLLPWLTVFGNLRLVAPHLALEVAAARLAELGIGHTMELYPHQLSLGMQRRVALLRALINEPEVVLLDEPFASLDVESRDVAMRWLCSELRRTRATTVLATHDLRDAACLADRVVELHGLPARARVIDLAASARLQRSISDIDHISQRLDLELSAAHA
jgi:ABC-type nitrate/sulfonate/bicarbonate transport system ATPase subunit